VIGGGEAAIMRTNIALVLGALLLLAGCGGVPYSDPFASPDTSSKADCERSGGYWHATPAVCEQGRR
jgi:hypothetical protein